MTTGPKGSATELRWTRVGPGLLRVSGRIAAGGGKALRNYLVDDPASFARSAFIQSLERAGVSVDAPATGANPRGVLPRSRSYPASTRVAQHVSPEFNQYATVVLKVSYNRGADLMVCLSALKSGSRNCPDGLERDNKRAGQAGRADGQPGVRRSTAPAPTTTTGSRSTPSPSSTGSSRPSRSGSPFRSALLQPGRDRRPGPVRRRLARQGQAAGQDRHPRRHHRRGPDARAAAGPVRLPHQRPAGASCWSPSSPTTSRSRASPTCWPPPTTRSPWSTRSTWGARAPVGVEIRRMVVLGAGGDLAARLLLPGLAGLLHLGSLPEGFTLVGVDRPEWDDATFQKHVHDSVAEHGDPGAKKAAAGAGGRLQLRARRRRRPGRAHRGAGQGRGPGGHLPGAAAAGVRRRDHGDRHGRPSRRQRDRHREALRPRPRRRPRSSTPCWPPPPPSTPSTASTTSSRSRRSRTCSACASPTACSSRCGTTTTSSASRSCGTRTWPWRGAPATTTTPAPCAT